MKGKITASLEYPINFPTFSFWTDFDKEDFMFYCVSLFGWDFRHVLASIKGIPLHQCFLYAHGLGKCVRP